MTLHDNDDGGDAATLLLMAVSSSAACRPMSAFPRFVLFDRVGAAMHRQSDEDSSMMVGVVRRKGLPRWQSCW